MLIECTFCHAQAKIPDSKEGAKVKCGACGKIYVARDPKSAGRKKTNPAPFIIGGAVLLGLIVIIAIVSSGSDKTEAAPPVVQAPPPVKLVDRSGWDSEWVRMIRDTYKAAQDRNEDKLESLLNLEKAVEYRRAKPENAAMPEYGAMSALERDDLKKAILAQFLGSDGPQSDAAIALWSPFDGKVENEGDAEIVVRVDVKGLDESTKQENRVMEWRIAKDSRDGKWKVASWERWISPEEARAKKSKIAREVSLVKLEDGTQLYQAEPRPLAHLADTPPELREKIDGLVEKLLDLTLRAKQATAVKNDLIAIGKPALPILLTKMYEIHITDDTSLGQVTLVNTVLEDITGYDKAGFSPLGVGPESEKKRDIAIRAWFAWYLRKGESFEEKKEGVDLLEGMIEPTARDKREIEKARKSGDGN
jgi:hypothetical protein